MRTKRLLAGITSLLMMTNGASIGAYAERTAAVTPEFSVCADYDFVMEEPVINCGDIDLGVEGTMSGASYFSINPQSGGFGSSYYDQLDEESQYAYRIILEKFRDGYRDRTAVIPIAKKFVYNDELSANATDWACGILFPAINALWCDHPEIGWLRDASFSWKYSYYDREKGTLIAHDPVISVATDTDYGSREDIESAVSGAVSEINKACGGDMSVYNVLLQANNYLCRNITYNDEGADETSDAYTKAQRSIYQSPYSAFYPCNGESEIKTVCAGYAKAFKLLCDAYDIPCVYVSGNACSDGENLGYHAWNCVKIGDDWWGVDVTWNDQNQNRYFLAAANDRPSQNIKDSFEQSHRENGLSTGLEGMNFLCPSLKDSGAAAVMHNECSADSDAAKVKAGAGDVSKMGAGAGAPVTSDENGNILIKLCNFPDENFRKWVSENADTDKDGALSSGETAEIRDMDVSGLGILYLNGIEYFTALESLDCSGNFIKNFDTSRNEALTSLDCSENYLESVDMSANTALENFDCSDNELKALKVGATLKSLDCSGNKLGSLDISANTALMSLDCSGNELGSLDISASTALTSLNCSGNELESLDISANTALTSLDCSGNKLESLDISSNTDLAVLNYKGNSITSFTVPLIPTLFPDDIFRGWLSKNADKNGDGILSPAEISGVKSVDVKGMGIRSLEGIRFLIGMTDLNCSENLLGEIDISFNTSLTSLDVIGNDLAIVDISGNTALRHLNTDAAYRMGKNNDLISVNGTVMITPTAFPDEAFRGWVSKNADNNGDGMLSPAELRAVKVMDISGLGISELSGIEYFTSLENLDCSGNELSDIDISLNVKLIMLNGSLLINSLVFPDESFKGWVGKNADKDKDGMLSPEELKGVKVMDISGLGIAELGGIEYFVSLESLDCSGNELESLDISRNTALTTLNCSGNKLSSLDISANTAITSLDYTGNPITDINTRPGDANADGVLSAADVVMIQKYLTNKSAEIKGKCDANHDGIINVFDLIMVKRTVLGA